MKISEDMISEQFIYKGFTFQKMTKDGMWYVIFSNQIVNWGQYRSDLKEWVDINNPFPIFKKETK